jgi:hypothetical protein
MNASLIVPDELKVFFNDKGVAKFETKIVFNYMEFTHLFTTHAPNLISKLERFIKEQTGQYWDNPRTSFATITGAPFSFSVYGTKLIVWAHDGSLSLGHFEATVKGAQEALRVAKAYEHGKIHCSGCGQEVLLTEIGGHFYAGSYCQRCWNEDWIDAQGRRHENMKAVERRENYD